MNFLKWVFFFSLKAINLEWDFLKFYLFQMKKGDPFNHLFDQS